MGAKTKERVGYVQPTDVLPTGHFTTSEVEVGRGYEYYCE
jgi:hypothetical protein